MFAVSPFILGCIMKIKVTGSVLCYNFSEEKFETVYAVCKHEGIKIRRAESCDFAKTVGQAMGFLNAGIHGDVKEEETKTFSDEMMVLANISGTSLNTFLKKLRELGVYIPLKATLTAANMSWLPAQLCEELKKEHEMMTAGKSEDVKKDAE